MILKMFTCRSYKHNNSWWFTNAKLQFFHIYYDLIQWTKLFKHLSYHYNLYSLLKTCVECVVFTTNRFDTLFIGNSYMMSYHIFYNLWLQLLSCSKPGQIKENKQKLTEKEEKWAALRQGHFDRPRCRHRSLAVTVTFSRERVGQQQTIVLLWLCWWCWHQYCWWWLPRWR